jgi:hypothetical protein
LTKQDELLKYPLDEHFGDTKLEVAPQLVDNTLHLCTPIHAHLDSDQVAVQPKKRVVKTKMTTKNQLEKATSQLYNLENCYTTEKILNIDLDLYQMEEY